jgi:hypothetical protein
VSGKGPAEPFRKLLPQSWLGWFAAFVLGVVAVTHPSESWHATSRTVWGAGRWAGYEAFAHCGDPAPYSWMSEKRCPDAVTVSDQGRWSRCRPGPPARQVVASQWLTERWSRLLTCIAWWTRR